MPSTAIFPRSVRMLDKPAFDAVLRHPQGRTRRSGLQLLWRANGLGHARLGMIVPKRQLRLAVQRNALKRRIREVFRTQSLPPADCVVRLVSGRDLLGVAATGPQLTGQVKGLFGKMVRAEAANRASSPGTPRRQSS